MTGDPHTPRFALGLDIAFDVAHADAVLAAACATNGEGPALEVRPHIGALPNEPHVPSDLRGRKAVVVAGTYHGHLQDGYALVRRLRNVATPLIDRTAPVDVS
jgi:hypothetical protein